MFDYILKMTTSIPTFTLTLTPTPTPTLTTAKATNIFQKGASDCCKLQNSFHFFCSHLLQRFSVIAIDSYRLFKPPSARVCLFVCLLVFSVFLCLLCLVGISCNCQTLSVAFALKNFNKF